MLAANLSNSVIVGYMVSVGYAVLNMMTKDKYAGHFYLASMTGGSYDEKYWLLAGSMLSIAAAFAIKPLKRRLA